MSLTALPGGMPTGWGDAGDSPIVGDWNDDGYDTIGLYRPATQHTVLNDDLPKFTSHTLTITTPASGTPNPVASGGTASLERHGERLPRTRAELRLERVVPDARVLRLVQQHHQSDADVDGAGERDGQPEELHRPGRGERRARAEPAELVHPEREREPLADDHDAGERDAQPGRLGRHREPERHGERFPGTRAELQLERVVPDARVLRLVQQHHRRTPTWTAPANATGSQKSCTVQVVVSDGHGLSQPSSYAQTVAAGASACSGHFICEDFGAAASGWTFNGDASQSVGEGLVELTPDQTYRRGSAFFDTPASIGSFEATFGVRLDAAGSPVADGLTFAVIEAGPTTLGISGACLGYCGTTGRSFAIELDTYNSVEYGDPAGLHVGLDVDGSVVSAATASLGPIVNQGLLTLRVVFSAGVVDVFLRGGSGYPAEARVLTARIPSWTPFVGYFGFTGATGGFSARQVVDSLDRGSRDATPTLTTNAASPVGQSGATLDATVNPNGSLTSAYFDYGPSLGTLAQTVSCGSVGSGSSNVAVSLIRSPGSPAARPTTSAPEPSTAAERRPAARSRSPPRPARDRPGCR